MEDQNKKQIAKMLTNNKTDSLYYIFALLSTISIPLIVYLIQ